MAYIDSAYYTAWGGTVTTDFTVMANRASDVIDLLTQFRARDFDELTELQQELIKKACCCQVDFFAEYGINSAVYGGESWTVGKVSVGQKNGIASEYIAKGIAPSAVDYLEQSGLMYRGVMVL